MTGRRFRERVRYDQPHGAWRSLVSALVSGTQRTRVQISAPR